MLSEYAVNTRMAEWWGVAMKRKFEKNNWWWIAGAVLMVVGLVFIGGPLGMLLFLPICFELTYLGMALIAYYITLKTNQPKLEILKSVSGIYFFGGSFPPFYNWPLYIVSIAAAVVYLAKLKHTNGRKTSVIVYLVLSCLGLAFSLWMVKVRHPGEL